MSTNPSTKSTVTAAAAMATATRPPVEIHPTAHLDPGAYVRGTHAISLGAGVLVHPRAMLASVHGPLIINDGAIIMEKTIIGGPIDSSSSSTTTTNAGEKAGDGEVEKEEEEVEENDPLKTVIGANVLISAHAQIHAGATIGDAAIIETRALIGRGARVGAHAKVCAGIIIERDESSASLDVDGGVAEMVVGDWEVVLGGGTGAVGHGRKNRRRKRMAIESVEMARIKAMQREKETTVAVLKSAARAPILRKK